MSELIWSPVGDHRTRSGAGLDSVERHHQPRDHVVERASGIDHGDVGFVDVRPLERRELAGDHPRTHVVVVATLRPPRCRRFVKVEEHEPHIAGGTKGVAVRTPQRRTRHDDIVTLSQHSAEPSEPRPAIGVGERFACRHLGDALR